MTYSNTKYVARSGRAECHDQKARRDHLCGDHFAHLQAVIIDIGRGDVAAVENIKPQRLRRLRLLLGAGRRETAGHECRRGRQDGGRD